MDYEDVGDIPMMSPVGRRNNPKADDGIPLPPPPLADEDDGPPPPPPPGPPPDDDDDDNNNNAAAARPAAPNRSKFAGTGRFARSVGRGGGRESSSGGPPPPPPPPPSPPPPHQDTSMSMSHASSAASYYEDVGDIPMIRPPPPPPADAAGGPARPAPGAAGARIGDVDASTGVPAGPIAASPGQASLAHDEAEAAAAAAAAKKRGGIAKGIGKKLFGADGDKADKQAKDAGEAKDEANVRTMDDDDYEEVKDREHEYVVPNFGLEEDEGDGESGRPPLGPPRPDREPEAKATPPRNLGGDMDFERGERGEQPGGIAPADSKEEFLRTADDLQRQSEAVFAGGAAAAAAAAGAKEKKDDAVAPSSSVVGTSVAVPHDTMGPDMDASSLSQTAILNDRQLRSALEPQDPVSKQDEEEDEKEDADDGEETETEAEAAATATPPDESSGDMMSDILGVTMPDHDVDETMEGSSDVAPKVDEAASLDPEEKEEEEGGDEMYELEKNLTDSLAAEEDKFNDIPPPSPKPRAAVNNSVPTRAFDRPMDEYDESPMDEYDESPMDEYDDSPIDSGAAGAAAEDQQSDDSQKAEQVHENEEPIQPTESAEDRLDDDLRKVTEDLAAAGISTSDKDAMTAVPATVVDERHADTASGAAATEEADGDDIPATPEVSVDDVALEGVRLSAIDDEVSPIKAARGEDGDLSRTSGGSAVNLDLSGPGGDGEWESDAKAKKTSPPEPKTLKEKAEAADAAASAAIAASKLPQDYTATATREEDPPAISLSLTDESLDDRTNRTSDPVATKQKDTPKSPKSPLSRFSEKKKKAIWRAVVDEASGDVYYYNRKTRTTTWDRPEGVEINERKRTFPDESATTTLASEEAVSAEESTRTETIALGGVTSDLARDDATNGEEADEQQRQINGDHEDATKNEAEDEVGEPEHDQDLDQDQDQNQDQASDGKWKAVVDKTSGQTYYYHTATEETTWDKPDDYVEKKGVVKRGRQAAGALGGLIRRSTKHVIGGKTASKNPAKTPATATANGGDMETPPKKKSARNVLGFGKKKEAGHSPDALSQDVSSDVDPDGYSGMDTSGEGDHSHGAADFSVAAMDTPDKVQLPNSAAKGRFVPSLGSPSEKDELNMSDGSVDKGEEGEADNSVGPSGKKGEKSNQFWRAIIDANTLNTYYYNVRTKETTWDKPEGFQDISKEELNASLE